MINLWIYPHMTQRLLSLLGLHIHFQPLSGFLLQCSLLTGERFSKKVRTVIYSLTFLTNHFSCIHLVIYKYITQIVFPWFVWGRVIILTYLIYLGFIYLCVKHVGFLGWVVVSTRMQFVNSNLQMESWNFSTENIWGITDNGGYGFTMLQRESRIKFRPNERYKNEIFIRDSLTIWKEKGGKRQWQKRKDFK